jgi:hypothetical protein
VGIWNFIKASHLDSCLKLSQDILPTYPRKGEGKENKTLSLSHSGLTISLTQHAHPEKEKFSENGLSLSNNSKGLEEFNFIKDH